MSSKQDVTSPRNATDLERKYNFGRSFSEVMGIATDARNFATKAEKVALSVQQKMLDINIVEELNASADVITLNSNRLVVNSDYFKLSDEGKITATSGKIANWSVSESGLSAVSDSYWVRMTAPEIDSDNFLHIAQLGSTGVINVPFYVKADGSLFCTKADIRGKLTADEGEIGGWTVLNTDTAKGLYYYDLDTVQGTGFQPPNSGAWAISVAYTNQSNWGTGRFRVRHNGDAYCQKLYLEQDFKYDKHYVSISGNDLHGLLTQICGAIAQLDERIFMMGGNVPLSIAEVSTNEQTT